MGIHILGRKDGVNNGHVGWEVLSCCANSTLDYTRMAWKIDSQSLCFPMVSHILSPLLPNTCFLSRPIIFMHFINLINNLLFYIYY